MTFPALSFLEGAGARADPVVPLTWATLFISIAVSLVVAVLLVGALRRGRASGGAEETRSAAVERGGNGLRWIGVGLVISSIPLAATLIWTMGTLAAVANPPRRPELVVDVTAHQWWWEIQYSDGPPFKRFATANELHIPVGSPVLVRLHGGDVIHSFWVPKLSGKTDAIPGQTNQTWLQADVPGVYRGQCGEYCGLEHAKMAFEVVAQPQAEFAAWRTAQLQTAPPPATPAQVRGLALVEFRCGLCHRVRGTDAAAVIAPDLTHLMSRRSIAAGTLPNNSATLSGWILDPQSSKPGALMPAMPLSGPELADVRAYLETLR